MAPSFEVGSPNQSLVRISGSGLDKSLKSTCLTVASISRMCRELSTVLSFNFNGIPSQTRKRPLTAVQNPSKRPRVARTVGPEERQRILALLKERILKEQDSEMVAKLTMIVKTMEAGGENKALTIIAI